MTATTFETKHVYGTEPLYIVIYNLLCIYFLVKIG